MTLITQPNVSAILAVTSTVRYLNQYRCPTCQTEWEDEWDCGCNDRCPDCNKEIEPYESALIADDSVETDSPGDEPSLATSMPKP